MVFDPSLYAPLLQTIRKQLQPSDPIRDSYDSSDKVSNDPLESIRITSKSVDQACTEFEAMIGHNKDIYSAMNMLSREGKSTKLNNGYVNCDDSGGSDDNFDANGDVVNGDDSNAVNEDDDSNDINGEDFDDHDPSKPLAIIAVTLRNEEALENFLDMLGEWWMKNMMNVFYLVICRKILVLFQLFSSTVLIF